MDKRCTVCNHSQAHEINLALLAGLTLDNLKQQFGLSRSALHRHEQHLHRTIDQAEDRLRNNFLLSYLFQLNDYNAAAAATVAAARAEGNARLTLQAANAGTRIINNMAKFGVDLDHETIYRLITSRDYVQPDSLLPGDPQILAGPRLNLVRSLAAACPETAPDALFDPEDVAAYLKLAQEPDANTHLPQARQQEFPGFLIPLTNVLPSGPKPTASHAGPCLPDPSSLIPDPCLSDPSSLFPNPCLSDPCLPDPSSLFPNPCLSNPCLSKPEEMRDNSGTEAGQISPLSENIEEFKRDRQEEKITGTNLAPDPLPTASHPPATLNEAGPRDTLDDAQAAELAEYLANFSPYAKPAVDPAPDLTSPIPGPGAAEPGRKPPPPYDETARRADELFEISHGYKRNNPPKHVPNRRRDEDFRSNSIFGDPSKIYG